MNAGMNGTRMMKRDTMIKNILTALLISSLTVSVALASALAKPKADGLIGEQANGYIGFVVKDVPADVRKLVNETNAKRKAGYQEIAKKQGTTLSEVEKVGGNTAYEKTLKGNYYQDASGAWRKK